jgi:hypothetical protein
MVRRTARYSEPALGIVDDHEAVRTNTQLLGKPRLNHNDEIIAFNATDSIRESCEFVAHFAEWNTQCKATALKLNQAFDRNDVAHCGNSTKLQRRARFNQFFVSFNDR